MSISTYSELTTSVSNWMHRSDLVSMVPDFIQLGEVMLNRDLRLASMENVSTINTSITDRFATLPTGFLEAIDLALYSDSYPQVLTQVPLSEINFRSIATGSLALPHFYAVTSNIVFDTISDQVYPCALRYYKKLDITTDLTNSVLTNSPDLYLNSAFLYASIYTKDDQRAAEFRALLSEGIKTENRKDARNKGKAMLLVEPGLRRRIAGDIFTGESW